MTPNKYQKPCHPQQRESRLVAPPLVADSKPLGKAVFLILVSPTEASCYEPQCVTSGLPNRPFVQAYHANAIVHKNTGTLTWEQEVPATLVPRVAFLLLASQPVLVRIRPVRARGDLEGVLQHQDPQGRKQ